MYALDLENHEGAEALITQLKQINGVREVEASPVGLRIFADNADGLLPEIVRASNRFGLRDLTVTETSLETVFIRLTGRDLRE